ncbi:MAG TPA: divalent-cation tolerance protein CutA [Bryobacteraceae bacterium]|nr:divalent-cation tolerance protein CutA [Bryobacteraceae bacterium]
MTDKILIFSSCGSAEEAERVAKHLVETHAAACVNIIPGVRSIYRWKGAVEEAGEWTLLIKTRRPLVARVERELRRVHSYEVPELIALPIVAGLESYLQWIDDETGNAGP